MHIIPKFAPENWIKSSFCESSGCVEVIKDDEVVYVSGGQFQHGLLKFTREEWDVFVRGVKAGEFDL